MTTQAEHRAVRAASYGVDIVDPRYRCPRCGFVHYLHLPCKPRERGS